MVRFASNSKKKIEKHLDLLDKKLMQLWSDFLQIQA